MTQARVLISGAGIAGPSLAHWLLRYGFEPTLIERAPAFREGGYMIDVWGTGFDMLKRSGLLEAARQRGYLFDRLKFVDAQGKEVSALGRHVFHGALGERFFSIPRGDLARLIYATIENRMEVIYGMSVRTVHQDADGVDVELSSGAQRRFDLLVGADGLHSGVREVCFGPEARFERYLGYVAASFITNDYPHRDVGVYVSHGEPGWQVSRYAMRENRSAFLFVLAQASKPAVDAHDSQKLKSFLRERFAGGAWELPEILARLDAASDLYFDPVSQIRMPQWSQGRIVLVGDAAHCPSLLAGAGAAFGMLGAYVLADELHRAQGGFSQAFKAYEQRLQPFMARQQDAAARFASSFAPRTAVGLRVRDWVLHLMNIPLLGSWLVRTWFADEFLLPP